MDNEGMTDEVMTAPMEFTLKYCFDIADISQLEPGDKVSSSCPPTDTIHGGRRVVISPGGFPLHFSLHLIYEKPLPGSSAHRFILQLALELQPCDVPYVLPFRIQPISIPRDQVRRPMHMAGRLLGPLQAEVWGFRWRHLEPWPPAAASAVGDLQLTGCWDLPGPGYPWTGVFRFQLLDDDPPPSEAEWSCLPEDMVSAVLRELPLTDRVSARLVCHTWSRLLDTDSRVWSNVTHVQSIRRKTPRKGGLNQVRDHNLYKALGFLIFRKATIRSLELEQDPLDTNQVLLLTDLPSELSQRKIKLKALLFHATDAIECWQNQNEVAEAALLKLIESQPSLERLHLEFVSIPIASLVQALPQLRILSLLIASEDDWEAFQAQPPPLSGLDGFRVAFTYYCPDSAEIANISSIVEGGSRLRRVKGNQDWPPGYEDPYDDIVVWGTENVSPVAAAFLLMPSHCDSRYAIIKDHRI